MSKVQPVIRAIDIGYGNTKFTRAVHLDGTPEFMMFPSLAPISVNRGLNGGGMARRETVTIEIDGVGFEVGPDARLLVDDQGEHPDHEQYIDTAEYLALNLGALHYMGEAVIDLLVVGLPVSLVATRNRDLTERLKGHHSLPGGRDVLIRDVLVVAQPLGGFISHAYAITDERAIGSKMRIIVDPGFVTLDWMVVNGTKAVESRCGAARGGMRRVLQSIADGLSEDRELNPRGERYRNLERIDEGLRTGHFRYEGREVPLSKYLPRALATVNKAVEAMKNSIGTVKDVDEVVLVGGGAGFFRPVMKHVFPHHEVFAAAQSIYANVRGFQILGQRMYDKRRMAA